MVLRGHDNTVNSVRFSADGRKIVSASYDHTVRIWDAESGKQLQTFRGHTDRVFAARFSPDGHAVVSCSGDGTIRLWDIHTRNEVMKFKNDSNKIWDVNFSPDGKYIISCLRDNTIRLWDIHSGIEIKQLLGYSRDVLSAQFSSDGIECGILKEHLNHVNDIKYLPDGQTIVSCSSDNTIRLWNVKSRKRLQILEGHSQALRCVDVSQNGNHTTPFIGLLRRVQKVQTNLKRMITHHNEKQTSTQPTLLEKEIQIIIRHWIRILKIKLGWINDFDKLVVNYTRTVFIFDTFSSLSKLINTFTGHTNYVWSIDYSTFDDCHFICSGSHDKTVRVWDIENNKQIQSFNGHSSYVYCVKFSLYHYHNHHQNVICSSSNDNTIRFWDFKYNKQLQILREHYGGVCGIEFSPFNNGKYLCSTSGDKTIRLWNVETYKQLNIFNGHENGVCCVAISPLQSNNNNNDNKSNNIGVIGGNGYTICSGSFDKTIRIWDIETTKQLILFVGHQNIVKSVKYGSNELENIGCANTILSGSEDNSVRLWDIRSGQQIQVFNGHSNMVNTVEYSPFVTKNNTEISGSCSNVICSTSDDNTIRFWDIRSNKKELYLIEGDKEDNGIICLKFISLKKKLKNNKQKLSSNHDSLYVSIQVILNYKDKKKEILQDSVLIVEKKLSKKKTNTAPF
ncbi:WD-40 repeat protein [Reticulomyxa filosa]|uniref:WD-40 repeat protein n=1 Tax=Reticulomyxa filosa TaxID=46433 RepID=X6MQ98_RETFI|nr:WD-40 repeat protein [Reticulomyxa filosa]|eukprot:ETO15612.1 WD-40 repeat protein [Reticulomyxa filosa]